MNEDSYLIEAIRAPRFDPYRTCGARKARGPLPASKLDYHELLKPYLGRTYRHRFTGQVRFVYGGVLLSGREIFVQVSKSFKRSPRKALDWLRNAVEV